MVYHDSISRLRSRQTIKTGTVGWGQHNLVLQVGEVKRRRIRQSHPIRGVQIYILLQNEVGRGHSP